MATRQLPSTPSFQSLRNQAKQLHRALIDQDPEALELAQERLNAFGDRIRLRHGRMSDLSRLIRKERIPRPIGVLLDIGVSSMQLDRPERGFSFNIDGPLVDAWASQKSFRRKDDMELVPSAWPSRTPPRCAFELAG